MMLQDPTLRNPIAISLGAIAGALSRYYITIWFTQRFGSAFPYGTFFINLTGCFIMGFFVTFSFERVSTIPPEMQLMVTTGFLGAYTTFSTYGLESLILLRDALSGDFPLHHLAFSFYWVGSAIFGVICVHLGASLARLGQ